MVRLTLLVGFHGELFRLLHGDLFARNLVVDGREVFLRQVFAVVDAAVHLDVLLFCHFVLHLCGRQQGHGSEAAYVIPVIYADI